MRGTGRVAQFGRGLDLAPGPPDIVVQDPYDIEPPRKVILSNNGRYRAHLFDSRYRVFDLRTGAKIIDRAGHDVNFSPTARFVVANAGSSGSQAHDAFEVIDLATGDVVSTAQGPFIGFAEGDAFVIDGHGDWGALSVRPTLISRPVAKPADPNEEAPDDGLALRHPGSCHACNSWVDDNLILDLDNGILAYTGTFEKDKTPVFELASGAQLCCAKGMTAANLIAPKLCRSARRAAHRLAIAHAHRLQSHLRSGHQLGTSQSWAPTRTRMRLCSRSSSSRTTIRLPRVTASR